MKFDLDKNYCILSNSITKEFLTNFDEYDIYDDSLTYQQLKEIIENYLKKTIVFNECLRKFKENEKKKIIELIKLRHVNFINITSNIEETIYSDYMYVYHDNKLAIEGATKGVLQEEKLLKRLGFGLPFVVDISIQLNYYKLLNKTYYDLEELVNDLWN